MYIYTINNMCVYMTLSQVESKVVEPPLRGVSKDAGFFGFCSVKTLRTYRLGKPSSEEIGKTPPTLNRG
jgi:hypothetical protein